MSCLCGTKRGKAAARPAPRLEVHERGAAPTSPPSKRKTNTLLSTDRTALEKVEVWDAVENGDLNVLRKLDKESFLLLNKHQDTLLHFAASHSNAETVLFLIEEMEKGAVNAVNVYHETPLHKAASLGKADVVRALISAGADVNIPNSYDETPFYIACYGGHIPVITQLLGVPRCRYLESGEANLRPMALAAVRGHSAIVQIITRHDLWKLHRLLWIGFLRCRPDSPLSLLSRDLIVRIARLVTPPRYL